MYVKSGGLPPPRSPALFWGTHATRAPDWGLPPRKAPAYKTPGPQFRYTGTGPVCTRVYRMYQGPVVAEVVLYCQGAGSSAAVGKTIRLAHCWEMFCIEE